MIWRSGRRTQRGQGLLLLMLVMMVVGASALLAGIGGRASIRAGDDEGTARALALAKEALIAYGVDINSPTSPNRPGSLVCPDVDNDGQSDITPCTSLGWFPYRTLGLEELRDGSGARLWYAVSPNYRSNVQLIRNSEGVLGEIAVDVVDDIVAVLIAPGEPLDLSAPGDPPDIQTRPGADFDASDPTQREAFLEGANASSNMQVFSRGSVGAFNDQLMVITRTELMRAVERRVIGEAAAALRAYSASWEGSETVFPWLKSYEDPRNATNFHGQHGEDRGLLPLHHPAGEAFGSPWRLEWSDLSDAEIVITTPLPPPPPGTVSAEDLRSGPLGGLAMPEAPANCTWFAGDPGRARCSGSVSVENFFNDPTYLGFPVISSSRTYTFTNIEVARDIDDIEVHPPTVAEVRTRSVRVTPLLGAIETGGRIEIEDVVVVDNAGEAETRPSGNGRLTTTSQTSGTMSIIGVRYWLDPANELPVWFTANQWHHLVYVVASRAYLAGGSGDCVASGNCLSLVAFDGDAASSTVGIGVIVAGAEGVDQDRADAAIEDYLEKENGAALSGDNSIARRRYDLGVINALDAFNDQVRVMLRGEL